MSAAKTDKVFQQIWDRIAGKDREIGSTQTRAIVTACVEELGTRTGEPFDEGIYQVKFRQYARDGTLTKAKAAQVAREMSGKVTTIRAKTLRPATAVDDRSLPFHERLYKAPEISKKKEAERVARKTKQEMEGCTFAPTISKNPIAKVKNEDVEEQGQKSSGVFLTGLAALKTSPTKTYESLYGKHKEKLQKFEEKRKNQQDDERFSFRPDLTKGGKTVTQRRKSAEQKHEAKYEE